MSRRGGFDPSERSPQKRHSERSPQKRHSEVTSRSLRDSGNRQSSPPGRYSMRNRHSDVMDNIKRQAREDHDVNGSDEDEEEENYTARSTRSGRNRKTKRARIESDGEEEEMKEDEGEDENGIKEDDDEYEMDEEELQRQREEKKKRDLQNELRNLRSDLVEQPVVLDSRARRSRHQTERFGATPGPNTPHTTRMNGGRERDRYRDHDRRRSKGCGISRRRNGRRKRHDSSDSDFDGMLGIRNDVDDSSDSDNGGGRSKKKGKKAGAMCADISPIEIDTSKGFETVGGMDSHVLSLREMVLLPMLYPQLFQQGDVSPPKGVVFYGPPGTGKTLLARALAAECGRGSKKVAFFMRKGADVMSKWVGESERQLRLLFEQANAMRPSIIFFDEIDGLAPVRSSRQDQIHASIVSTLLALMDGLDNRGDVVVIGATNRLDAIDPALRRPGRFDRELAFRLPDLTARSNIIAIHTKQWANPPDDQQLKWLGEQTSGYSGADLKLLCTECFLAAMRSSFPHMYISEKRLDIRPEQLHIEKCHWKDAMRRIVPSTRRDLASCARPLEERPRVLLNGTIDEVVENALPAGYRASSSPQSSSAGQLERVVNALAPKQPVPAARVLLVSSTDTCLGQSQYILPAVLASIDHLPVFSLAIHTLFADGRVEECLSQCLAGAIRAASSGPCVMVIPSADAWAKAVPAHALHMLSSFLSSLPTSSSLLLLGSADCAWENLPDEMKAVFENKTCYQINAPSDESRKAYWQHVLSPATAPPQVFDDSRYFCPPLAPEPSAKEKIRELTESEAKDLLKQYKRQQLMFRNFLREMTARLLRESRFRDFVMPVNAEEVEDYYEVIKYPMCLTDMTLKIDCGEYQTPEQWMADIKLILSNALEYNPDTDEDGRKVRHAAMGLKEKAEELLDMEMEEKFIEKMKTRARLLSDVCMPDVPILVEGEQAKREKARLAREQAEKEQREEKERARKHREQQEKWKREMEENKTAVTHEFVCDVAGICKLVKKWTKRTADWGVLDMEQLAVEVESELAQWSREWNRSELLGRLKEIMKSKRGVDDDTDRDTSEE